MFDINGILPTTLFLLNTSIITAVRASVIEPPSYIHVPF
ncbi:hypothetical protein VIBNISOn1_1390019 [Vibrio nigripulchritudo SOn1]|uniref:Uncharacterized protein n=1 Tax=Vibrio nigripulchritudo SOn1 TaxID=1238450 RepID=A0AAV2VKB3_9VIBR|nr:hypothetical protein VIBNISOn1_1390019 [Vibrio nigripulchritudo SOn1]